MKLKNEYQMFFKQKCFTHHITLPPSPLTEKSVVSVMRKIEFKYSYYPEATDVDLSYRMFDS